MANRVWIELDIFKDPGAARKSLDRDRIDHDLNKERAALLDKMLRRLGVMSDYQGKLVFWHEDKCRYGFTIDSGGGYVEAGDNGHWYNLDYLGEL